jgi:hypothetical protein
MVPYYIYRMRSQRVRNAKSGWPRFLPNRLNIFFIFARWHRPAIPNALFAFKLYQPSVFSFYDYYWWLLHADETGFGFFIFKYLPLLIILICFYIAFRKIFTYAVNSPEQIAWALGAVVLLILLVIYFLILAKIIVVPKW